MVGIKRTRPRQEQEESEVETASSSLRHNNDSRKRVRLTPVDGGSEDDESLLSVTQQDQDEEEEEDVDLADLSDDEVMARTRGREHFREAVANSAADMGIIEEVQCRNFMCHSNLSIKLGPNINFIIGHNGSGKSAVLTALTVCLGGKASATNRGQSLKSFIKTGSEQASLSAKIKNQGEAAFQAQIYGNSITVERFFSRSGTSGFKIKNQHGKVISTKKSDLEDILDGLALMMDNPMNVLSQDMARQFLNSSNAKEKYRFFYQGTHLEQLDSDYRILAESLQQNQDQVYNLAETAKAATDVYDKAKKKAELAERAETLVEQYRGLSRQMAWIQVRDEEDKLSAIEANIRRQEVVIDDRKAAFAELDAGMADLNQRKDQAQEAEETAQADKASKTEERDAAKSSFDEIKNRLMEFQTEQREIQVAVNNSKKTVARLKADVDKEREKIASADDGRHAEKMEEIQATEQRHAALKEQVEQKSSEGRSFDAAVREAETKAQESAQAQEAARNDVKEGERLISSLESGRGDWKSAYNRELPRLLAAIERETRFREKPAGPMGRHIKLLKQQWSSILEQAGGGHLNAFVVSNKADQSILTELMRRTGYDASVFVTSSRPIDTTGQEPPEEYDTWLRVLKIDHELVRNCLIINNAIEKTLLVEDIDRAKVMVSERIRNVRAIFSPQKGVTKYGMRFQITDGGGEANIPVKPWDRASRMQTDDEAQINSERENLARLKARVRECETRHREMQSKVTQANQAKTRHIKDLKNLRTDVQEIEVMIVDLKNALEEDTPQEQALEHLEGELRDAQETLQMNENAYGDSVVEKDKLNAEQRPIKNALNDLQKELDEMDERISAAHASFQASSTERENALLVTNRAHAAIGDAEAAQRRLEREREEQIGVVHSFTTEATKLSERVPIDEGETVDSLDTKLARLSREQAVQREQLGGDKATLVLKKLEAKAYCDEAQRVYDNHKLILDTLKKALDNRQWRWKKFRAAIVIRAAGHFSYLLENRSFRGKLEIDHDDRTLDIKVQPDAAQKSDKGRQTKTLSGGEKSFSTICLLLALWEAMGSPVRCLDEFDVFMDQVNRDISMKMMIEAARNSTQRQFILITPQSMNNVHLGPDVKIHKMSDPERGQTTLSQFPR